MNDWLDERRKGVGGSDAPAILGIDPYRNAIEVYYDKIGELPPKGETPHMARGNILEPVIARMFADATGLKLRRVKAKVSKAWPWMRGNIDRLILSKDGNGNGVLEIKAPSIYADAWKDGPPDTAFVQLQHYLAVWGLKWGAIACWLGATEFRYWFIGEDAELIRSMAEAERIFWQNHVLKKVPPDGIMSSTALVRLYPESKEGATITLPENKRIKDLLAVIETANEEIKHLNAAKDLAENEVKQLMGDAEEAVYMDDKDSFAVSWKSQQPYNMYDTKALDADPAIRLKYKTKVVTKRPFKVSRKPIILLEKEDV